MRLTKLTAVFILLCAATLAVADTYVENFEGGTNTAGWTFGNSYDTIESSGGNPGYWFHNDYLITFGPILRCEFYADHFTGNYRSMNVTSISIDGRSDFIEWGSTINMSILLRCTNGTPGNYEDDDFAYFTGPMIPQPGEGWKHYRFLIPSQSTDSIPEGWYGGCGIDPENFRPGIDWNDIVVNVDRLEIWWWHPAMIGIIQLWDVGADNITITYEGSSLECGTWGHIKNLFGANL